MTKSIIAAGVAVGVTALYWLYAQAPKKTYDYCHGTTFSALYLMGKLQGKDKNCLIPFGELEKQRIPTFSGECTRGIGEHSTYCGINRKKTSWVPVDNFKTALGYSKRFCFPLQEDLAELRAIIKGNEDYLQNEWGIPPYRSQSHSAYWNKTLLRIRRVRAWDEALFKKQLKDGLQSWIDSEMKYFKVLGYKQATVQEQEDRWNYMHKLQKEIDGPVGFQLSPKDKEEIVQAYPIIFLASHKIESSLTGLGQEGEYAFSGNVQLGEDICGIATDPEYIDRLKAYLALQGLNKKVQVISIYAFSLDRLCKNALKPLLPYSSSDLPYSSSDEMSAAERG